MKTFLHSIRYFITIVSLSLIGTFAFGQSYTVDAPSTVEVGENFTVQYTITAQPTKALDIRPIPGLTRLAGPMQQSQRSSSNVNGKVTYKSEYTISYQYKATKPGSVLIPVTTAEVDGKILKTQSKRIEVIETSASKTKPTTDVFASMEVNKTKAYVGEPIYISFKLYTKYNSDIVNSNYPTFSGFYTQELEAPHKINYVKETINGQTYYSVLFKKMVIYPQKSGSLTLTPFEVDLVIQKAVGRSVWGYQYSNEEKSVKSKSLQIEVLPLPAGKPASFQGAVGEFNVKVNTDVKSIAANEAFNYTVEISGKGNLSLLQKPTINFPKDFEVYDPKVTEKITNTVYGDKGKKIYEYVIIPRHEGKFTIPELKFSYFNTTTKVYETSVGSAIPINVTKGTNNASSTVSNYTNNKEAVQYYGNDIRFIKTGDLHVKKENGFFFKSTLYYLLFIVPLALLIVYTIIQRKLIKQNQNIADLRNRKANKESKRRLKIAKKCLLEGKNNEYYDEVAKALWGYIADKYNIQQAELSKDYIKTFLTNKHVSTESIQEFIYIIEQCEMARFASITDENAKEGLYTKASNLIQEFEQIVK